jgi:Ca2+/Na+ antiporter
MATLIFTALLIASLYGISRGADLFIDSGSGLGGKIKLPLYLIGSLIVGIGTSLPELVTSLSAVIEDKPELVAPNVYGTVTANILAGLGLAAIALFFVVRKTGRFAFRVRLRPGDHRLDFSDARPLDSIVPIAIISVLLSVLLCADGTFSRLDAAFFFLCYLIFMASEVRKIDSGTAAGAAEQPVEREPSEIVQQLTPSLQGTWSDRSFRVTILSHVVLLVIFVALELALWSQGQSLGLGGIVVIASLVGVLVLDLVFARNWMRSHPGATFGELRESKLARSSYVFLTLYLIASLSIVFTTGDFIVKSVIFLSEQLGMEATVLTASIVALGTSLPDILVAIKIAHRGWHQMLIGHIVSSNVFDMLFIMAACGFLVPLPIDGQTLRLTIPAAAVVHLVLLVVLQDRKISASEGGFLFVSYIAYLFALYS